MTKYLITPSLLSSYAYYIQDEFKSPADSRSDFLRTLSREKFEPNESMKIGIKLENDIFDECNGKYLSESELLAREQLQHPTHLKDCFLPKTSYDEVVGEIAEIVNNGLWQQSVKKELKIGNQEFLLYGRTDVIKRDTVYDIKFTGNYELGKFLDSSQHLIYLYCSDLPNFSYLISDGKDWWREEYFNHAGVEDEIKSKVSQFLDYLENDKEAKEMFLTKWESK